MSFLYDLIFVLIFVFIIRRGWRRGVFSTFLRILGWLVAAAVIAGWSGQWAESVYQNVVEQRVVSAVSAAIPADAVAAINSGADAVESLQAMLDGFSGILGGQTIDASTANSIVSMLRQDQGTLAEAITQTVLQPMILGVLQTIIGLGILIVVLFIFRLFSNASARRSRRSGTILGKTNQILGAVLGVGESVLVGYVYAYALTLLSQAVTVTWLTPSILNNTTLVSRVLAL